MITPDNYVRKLLHQACVDSGGQGTWAKRHQLSQQYVNDVLRKRRAPGGRLLKALKLRKVVSYVQRGRP